MTVSVEALLGSLGRLARYFFLFAAAFLLLNLAFVPLRHAFPSADIPRFWPVSEVIPAVSGLLSLPRLAMILVSLAVLGFGVLLVARERLSRWLALFVGLTLSLATNGVLGWQEGFYGPVAGQNPESLQYYDDAVHVSDYGRFVAEYTARQPEYSTHTKTHPPGPVLMMAVCANAGLPPEAIAIVCGLGSLAAFGASLAIALKAMGLKERDASWWLLAALALPAVQIYSIYSIDATIATLTAVLLTASLLEVRWARIGLASLALIALLGLSFGSLVLAALAPALWRWRNRSWGEIAWIGALVALFLVALRVAFGYDYFASMLIASRLENPQGFRLLSDPVSYLATRLENLAEPILFGGPIALLFGVVWWRSPWRGSTEGRAFMLVLTLLGIAFLTGAYRTGETARACLFVVPCAVLALARPVAEAVVGVRARGVALALVGLQAVAMQSLARFYW